MRHATPETLDRLEPLLAELRRFAELREKKRGTFYRRSQAFLHFHDDPAGLFADVRLEPAADFARVPVTQAREQRALLARVRAALSGPAPRR